MEVDIPTVHFVYFGMSTLAWSVGLQQTFYETVCGLYKGRSTDRAEQTNITYTCFDWFDRRPVCLSLSILACCP